MIYTALLLGLVSSLHCIGMCGPIAMMLPVDRKNPARQTLQLILYHLGRIISYGSIGLIFGMLGRGFYLAGIQQEFSIVAGSLMILIAVVPEKKLANFNFSKPVFKIISRIKSELGSQFTKKSLVAFLTSGILNGLLPCGLVYAALFGALAMQSTSLGILYMVLYGIGTVPLMSLVVYSAGFIKNTARVSLGKIVPVMIVITGTLFILRGLALDIPYLSPSKLSLLIQQQANCK